MTTFSKSEERLAEARTRGEIGEREYQDIQRKLIMPMSFGELCEAENRVSLIKDSTQELRDGVTELRKITKDMFSAIDQLRDFPPED